MQSVSLHILPEEEEAWTVEQFIDRIENTCRAAATELHRKSLMVEEAVEEILLLVKNAAQDFQSTQPDEFDFLKQDGKNRIWVYCSCILVTKAFYLLKLNQIKN